ncbi:MAG: DMT family transporter [Planctomycetota bacterium]
MEGLLRHRTPPPAPYHGIVAASAVAITVAAHLFVPGARLALRGWVGALVAVAGVGLVGGGALPGFDRTRLGDALQVLSCFTWAAYTLLGRRPVARSGALAVNTFAAFVAAPPLLVLAALAGPAHAAPGAREILALGFLGLLCGGVALALWYAAQHTHGSQRTAATLYLEPLVTVIVAVIVLGEPVGISALLGGGLVLAGVSLVRGAEHVPAAVRLNDG